MSLDRKRHEPQSLDDETAEAITARIERLREEGTVMDRFVAAVVAGLGGRAWLALAGVCAVLAALSALAADVHERRQFARRDAVATLAARVRDAEPAFAHCLKAPGYAQISVLAHETSGGVKVKVWTPRTPAGLGACIEQVLGSRLNSRDLASGLGVDMALLGTGP
ncbi:MAG: hypothetical protein IPG50_17130 [Myxococcales bacterium]|nr:hypothetical protein [Myxococcales bacterium]